MVRTGGERERKSKKETNLPGVYTKGVCVDELGACCGYGQNGALGSGLPPTPQTRPVEPDLRARGCSRRRKAPLGRREHIGAMPLVKDVNLAMPNVVSEDYSAPVLLICFPSFLCCHSGLETAVHG